MRLEKTITGDGYLTFHNGDVTLIRATLLDVIEDIDFDSIGVVGMPDGGWRNIRDDASLAVFSPSMGDGDSGVAAVRAGRRFIGLEADAAVFDTARRRIDGAILERAKVAS